MKNLPNYFVVVIVYNMLGVLVWYNQDLLLPLFITIYALINIYMMNKDKHFFHNFIVISGLMFIFEIIISLTGGFKPLTFQYMGLMLLISLLVYYLKKNFKYTNSPI